MKKLLFLALTFTFVLLFSTQNAQACSCAPLNIENYVNDHESSLFIGRIEEVISGRKVVVKVVENYSQNDITQYVILSTRTTIGASCGIDFKKYKIGDEILVATSYTNHITKKINSCSTRDIVDNQIHYIIINDNEDNYTVSELKEHINELDADYGDITENSLNVTTFIAYLPIVALFGLGIGMIGVLTILILRKRKVY